MTSGLPMLRNGSIVTACDIVEFIRTNAELESLLLEYGLSDQVEAGGSIARTVLNLKKFAVQHPDHRVMTDRGERPLASALVDKAIQIARKDGRTKSLLEKLRRDVLPGAQAVDFTDKIRAEKSPEPPLAQSDFLEKAGRAWTGWLGSADQ